MNGVGGQPAFKREVVPVPEIVNLEKKDRETFRVKAAGWVLQLTKLAPGQGLLFDVDEIGSRNPGTAYQKLRGALLDLLPVRTRFHMQHQVEEGKILVWLARAEDRGPAEEIANHES